MTAIIPEGNAIRNAIKWISDKRKENPGINIHKLVDEAGMRFNLSPKEEDFLLRFCREEHC